MNAYAARNILNTNIRLIDLDDWQESLPEAQTDLERSYKLFSALSMTGFRAIDKSVLADIEAGIQANNWDAYKHYLITARDKLSRFLKEHTELRDRSQRKGRSAELNNDEIESLTFSVIGNNSDKPDKD
ncbi:hypothetical protein [Photobacterium sp. R1]